MSGIMPRGTRQLLLPASPIFIWLSILMAFVSNMAQNFWFWGRASWAPDFLAVVIVFWNIHQPRRIGMGIAFAFGLAMDAYQSAILGQHALCYSILSFVAIALHRRILWFKTVTQAAQLLPLFATAHALDLFLRLIFGHAQLEWQLVLAPLLEALIWPIISALLLLPQYRAPDPDDNRPL